MFLLFAPSAPTFLGRHPEERPAQSLAKSAWRVGVGGRLRHHLDMLRTAWCELVASTATTWHRDTDAPSAGAPTATD
ncbi:hypothetical protein CKO18_10740 [Rhodoferax fermentans]|uniref:Uncharacterized protein n=1 Tax=Rhodoferax fermentans TaxID=28066 RepID=A0A1T1AXA2_RHOFE|nr:hypothetical protein [Rhodoferax fermentans]OOV08605.1 hypothetical protein RF819_19590 [Rhodoferax fermentans]